MNKLKLLILALFAACFLSSCTIDSVSYGVNAVSYPTYSRVQYIPTNRVHYVPRIRTYMYDIRPDYIRYSSCYRPVRRHRHR